MFGRSFWIALAKAKDHGEYNWHYPNRLEAQIEYQGKREFMAWVFSLLPSHFDENNFCVLPFSGMIDSKL